MKISDLDRRIRIERPAAVQGFTSAGKEAWEPVATVWAQVQDMLPSRGERLSEGMTMAARPARVRIRYREGITSDMRILLLRREAGDWAVERTMQITAGPAQLGRREWQEMTAEDYSTTGSGA